MVPALVSGLLSGGERLTAMVPRRVEVSDQITFDKRVNLEEFINRSHVKISMKTRFAYSKSAATHSELFCCRRDNSTNNGGFLVLICSRVLSNKVNIHQL